MEKLEIYTTKKEVLDQLKKLWKSPQFIQAMETPDSFIYEFCQEIAEHPLIFCHYTDYEIERPHFSSWYNVIPYRTYRNPVLSDLYYFHELWHRVSMRYFPYHLEEFNYATWMEKIRQNEIEASIYSEVIIHFILDGLRDDAFDHEIWADRFLNEEASVMKGLTFPQEMKKLSNRELFEQHFNFFVKALIDQRRRIVYADEDTLVDPIERQIKAYDKNNTEFMWIWRNHAEKVETMMSQFYKTCHYDILMSEDKRKKKAVKRLVESIVATQGNDPCPWYTEAKAFAIIYYGFKDDHKFKIYDTA